MAFFVIEITIELAPMLNILLFIFYTTIVLVPMALVLENWSNWFLLFRHIFFWKSRPKAWPNCFLFLILLLVVGEWQFFLTSEFFRSLDFLYFDGLLLQR